MAEALATLVKSELVTSQPGPAGPETGPVSPPILIIKLYIPPSRPEFISRPRLIERLNEGLHRKLTLVSAPAGFGKTTLISDWGFQLADSAAIPPKIKLAWLSLDEADNDPTRFLSYFIAALHRSTETSVERCKVCFTLRSPNRPPLKL